MAVASLVGLWDWAGGSDLTSDSTSSPAEGTGALRSRPGAMEVGGAGGGGVTVSVYPPTPGNRLLGRTSSWGVGTGEMRGMGRG